MSQMSKSFDSRSRKRPLPRKPGQGPNNVAGHGGPSGQASTDSQATSAPRWRFPTERLHLIIIFLVISIGGSYLVLTLPRGQDFRQYGYRVVAEYPHDPHAFTQGLVYHDSVLYESTGRYGQSSIRKVDLETGEILKIHRLADDLFGEGITILDDRLYQLTYRENVVLVYDLDLNEIERHELRGEGWGLTTDGRHLIVSDGTSHLRFLDPETMREVRRLRVRIAGRAAYNLNALQYVGDKIYANVWHQDFLYEIDPRNGNVTARISLDGLWPHGDRPEREAVLNGIAFNHDTERLIVTAKLSPHLWEIEFTAQDRRR